jgi:hypothetical protein
MTPQSGVRVLSERGHLIVLEVSEMADQEHPLFKKHRWRACYYDGREKDGKIMGIGEGPRKALAKEAGALDFLTTLQQEQPHLSIPNCVVPKGCRINPYVLIALESLCERLGYDPPSFTEDIVFVKGREKYKFSIFVDGREFSDTSYFLKFAKVCAAKRAFDALNTEGREFTYDDIILGSDCLKDVDYNFVESEELHVVQAKKPPPKRILGWETCELSGNPSPVPWKNEAGGSASGSTTPGSVSSFGPASKKIKISPVGESPMPPVLDQIRGRIQIRMAAKV